MWRWYDHQVKVKNPVRTKMITAGMLFGSSDVVCQFFEGKPKYDYARTLRMGALAGLYQNPMNQLYQTYFVPRVNIAPFFSPKYGNLANNALLAMLHFLTMSAHANVAQLFGTAFLKTGSFEEGKRNLQAKFVTSMQVGAYYWPWVHFINYHCLPIHMRMPFTDLSCFIFFIFISYLSNIALDDGSRIIQLKK